MFTAPYTIVTRTIHGIEKETTKYIATAARRFMDSNDPVEVYDANGIKVDEDILESL